MTPDRDVDRRQQLRVFLLHCRTRIQPHDVGLPQNGYRRVTGLRREEVAELAGVSSDWYRRFESGKPIRVSVPFLARLAEALRLTREEKQSLYHLALPEMYEITAIQRLRWTHSRLLSPVLSADEIPEATRQVARARDAFLRREAHGVSLVRPRVLRSWERSVALGVDPKRETVPAAVASNEEFAQRQRASRPLLNAAAPTLESLRTVIAGSGSVIIVTDANACVLQMVGDGKTLRMLSQFQLRPGGDVSESAFGTNPIGTAITDDRPLQLIGAENFCAGGNDWTGTAAPVHDPVTHRIVGAVDVTAERARIEPRMISIINQAALEIEERLASPMLDSPFDFATYDAPLKLSNALARSKKHGT